MTDEEPAAPCRDCGVKHSKEELYKFRDSEEYVCRDCLLTRCDMYRSFDDSKKQFNSFVDQLEEGVSLKMLYEI